MPDAAIQLDQWEILLTTTLLIPEGQEARIVLIPEDPLVVRIRFESSPPTEGEPRRTTVTISGKGNEGSLTFTNWNNPLSAAIEKPMEFADDYQGRPIAMMCFANKIGNHHQVFLQFMRRELQ